MIEGDSLEQAQAFFGSAAFRNLAQRDKAIRFLRTCFGRERPRNYEAFTRDRHVLDQISRTRIAHGRTRVAAALAIMPTASNRPPHARKRLIRCGFRSSAIAVHFTALLRPMRMPEGEDEAPHHTSSR
jgi:hypothetical protein